MFRAMRRFKQQLTDEECIEILKNSTSGVLAVSGENGYPYAVPMSFVYTDGKIYFHSAVTGHKVDAVKNNPLVSFCVTAKDDVSPAEFTTYYKSVIVFGKARILTDEKEIISSIRTLSDKYSFDYREKRDKEISGSMGRFCIIELNIEHMTGKQAKELLKADR